MTEGLLWGKAVPEHFSSPEAIFGRKQRLDIAGLAEPGEQEQQHRTVFKCKQH